MCDVIAPQGPVHSHPHLPIHKPQRGNMVTHGSLKTPLKEHQQSKIDSTFRNMPRATQKKREKHTSPKHGKGRAETGTPMSKSP